MSSIFDSAVYNLERNTPFAFVELMRFMREKAENSESHAVLSVCSRRNVASRLWWILSWEENGRAISVSAQDQDKLGWRAIQMHKQLEREFELANFDPQHPGDLMPRFTDGDGI